MTDLADHLKINELKDGYLYSIDARNAGFGIWNSKKESFIISRFKFGTNFIFEEYHVDCPAFATAMPLKELEKSPFSSEDFEMVLRKNEEGEMMQYIKEEEMLKYLNKFEEQKIREETLWRQKMIDSFKERSKEK